MAIADYWDDPIGFNFYSNGCTLEVGILDGHARVVRKSCVAKNAPHRWRAAAEDFQQRLNPFYGCANKKQCLREAISFCREMAAKG